MALLFWDHLLNWQLVRSLRLGGLFLSGFMSWRALKPDPRANMSSEYERTFDPHTWTFVLPDLKPPIYIMHSSAADSALYYSYPNLTFTTKSKPIELLSGSFVQERGRAGICSLFKNVLTPEVQKLDPHKRAHFPTRGTCAPLYWPSLLLFLNGILKAMFTAEHCALWSAQELQQILKYWLLSLLEERASGGRGRERERWVRWEERGRTHGQTDGGGGCLQVGVVWLLTEGLNLLGLNMCLPTVDVSREEGLVYWRGGGSAQR